MTEFLNDKDFFAELLHWVLSDCANKNILVVELRHTLGNLQDSHGKPVSLSGELDIFKHVIKHIKDDHPDFTFRMIVTGLKLLG